MSICINWEAVTAVAMLIVAIVAVVMPILQNRKWHKINVELQQRNAQIARNTQMYDTFNYLSIKTIKIVDRRNNVQGIDITSRAFELVNKKEKIALSKSDKYDFMMFDVRVSCMALRDIPIKKVEIIKFFVDSDDIYNINKHIDKSQIVDCVEVIDSGGNPGGYDYSFTIKTSLDWDSFLRSIHDVETNQKRLYLVASYINVVDVSVTCIHELQLEYLNGRAPDIFDVKTERLIRCNIDNER